MWNSRVTFTVLASVVLLMLLCAGVGAAYAPYYSDRRVARLTQNESRQLAGFASATQAVVATRLAHFPTETAIAGATETEAARPTITPTPTDTPTATPTSTATAPAAVAACSASVTGADRLLYPVPGGGRVRDAVALASQSGVIVVARLEDDGWLRVQTAEGQVGWMRSGSLSTTPANCQTNIYDLSYLLGLADGRDVVADDTMISNENGWTNDAGEPVAPALGPDGDAQLVLTANGVDALRPNSPRLLDVRVFELVTSFTRVNFVSDSYVGVRFRAGDLTYYEVRVQRNCSIGVYAVNELVFTRPVDPGPNTCTDEQADWLKLSLTADGRLAIEFNDADPFEVHLEDPSGLYQGGGLALVVGRARASFSFIVVTAPPQAAAMRAGRGA